MIISHPRRNNYQLNRVSTKPEKYICLLYYLKGDERMGSTGFRQGKENFPNLHRGIGKAIVQ